MQNVKKIVLAYSGGLDTSAIIPWLKENYGCEVVAFAADVGQGDEELEGLHEKAIASGASECHIVDLKEEFVSEYIFPTITTGAVYEGEYLLGTSMARPVIAKAQVEIARKVGADALCHGCTGKGNDQVRFESTFAALAPDLTVIAPWREWDMVSREDLLAYLAERNIATTASATKIYSRDANAWHISHEGGELEDPWQEPTKQVWTMTVDPEDAPDAP
ncbi:MAG: argininosuccinate synthase, partial [Alteromonas sp.]|nr:argininosuccinate synthase [Alteromonas sp.]